MRFHILLLISLPTFCFTQKTIDFEYFRRAGKVDINYYVKNDLTKIAVPVQHEITLENTSENQYFIIELSNLRLGLDKSTLELKQKKDASNYMVHVPLDPSSITLSTESLNFSSITNDGMLADVSTDRANKKIELYYEYKNALVNPSVSDLQIKFKVEALEGYRPLKEEHKGGAIIKCKIIVKPNEHYHQRKEMASAENKLFLNYKEASETAYKIKYAREYVSNYPGVNQERLDEIQGFLSNMANIINPIDYDKKIYEQIIKFCIDEQEKQRCENLCAQYQDFVWDNPKQYKGTFLERAYYYRIQLFSDTPNQQWVNWCEKYLHKFPSSKDRYTVESLRDDYLQNIENQKNKSQRPAFTGNYGVGLAKSEPQSNPEEPDELLEIEEEEEPLLPQKEDWAKILINENNSHVTIRTGGLSAAGYVVEFKHIADQLVKYDPSFVGEKKSWELDEVLEGKLKAGDYKISVYSTKNRETLATTTIDYYSTKLPQELTYVLMVSCIALGFFSYKKYVKL